MKNIQKSKNEEINKKCEKMKNKKARKKTGEKKKKEKKEKRAQRGTTRDGPKKLIFHRRTAVKRNRNEIDAQKKSHFEHPTKTKTMKENERK